MTEYVPTGPKVSEEISARRWTVGADACTSEIMIEHVASTVELGVMSRPA
jgi:hypothetical protein